MKIALILFSTCWMAQGAAYFDGANSYFTGPTSGNLLNSTGAVSVTFSFVTLASSRYTVSKGDADGSAPSIYELENTTDFRFFGADNLEYAYRIVPNTQSGIPYAHGVSMNFASGGGSIFYLTNGVLISGTWVGPSFSPSVGPAANNASAVNVGSRGGASGFWKGTISELAVWNTPLTYIEMRNVTGSKIKGLATQIKPANLTYYYGFESTVTGVAIAKAYDKSGNNNTLTGTGTPNPVGSPERWASYRPNE